MPELFKRLQSLNCQGIERRLWPQSRHWDWRDKLKAMEQRLANRSFAVVCEGLTQAMMIVDLTKRARVETQKGQHLVYVNFIEAAPWNQIGIANVLTTVPNG